LEIQGASLNGIRIIRISALGYRSPREYLRQRASNGLSDNRCLEI
ncbi:putative transposase subunit domain protein, partial [Escherichia coli MP021017.2]